MKYLQANIRLVTVHDLITLVNVFSILDLGCEWRANNVLVGELDSDCVVSRYGWVVDDVARAILVISALDLCLGGTLNGNG